MIKPGWEIEIDGFLIFLNYNHNVDYTLRIPRQMFQKCFPKFKDLSKLVSKRQRVNRVVVAVRKPIIKFLDAPTDNCWWLSCEQWPSSCNYANNYSIWLKRPVRRHGEFLGEDDGVDNALVEMCGDVFEEVYPHLKMRKNTVKPINKISFIRR